MAEKSKINNRKSIFHRKLFSIYLSSFFVALSGSSWRGFALMSELLVKTIHCLASSFLRLCFSFTRRGFAPRRHLFFRLFSFHVSYCSLQFSALEPSLATFLPTTKLTRKWHLQETTRTTVWVFKFQACSFFCVLSAAVTTRDKKNIQLNTENCSVVKMQAVHLFYIFRFCRHSPAIFVVLVLYSISKSAWTKEPSKTLDSNNSMISFPFHFLSYTLCCVYSFWMRDYRHHLLCCKRAHYNRVHSIAIKRAKCCCGGDFWCRKVHIVFYVLHSTTFYNTTNLQLLFLSLELIQRMSWFSFMIYSSQIFFYRF